MIRDLYNAAREPLRSFHQLSRQRTAGRGGRFSRISVLKSHNPADPSTATAGGYPSAYPTTPVTPRAPAEIPRAPMRLMTPTPGDGPVGDTLGGGIDTSTPGGYVSDKMGRDHMGPLGEVGMKEAAKAGVKGVATGVMADSLGMPAAEAAKLGLKTGISSVANPLNMASVVATKVAPKAIAQGVSTKRAVDALEDFSEDEARQMGLARSAFEDAEALDISPSELEDAKTALSEIENARAKNKRMGTLTGLLREVVDTPEDPYSPEDTLRTLGQTTSGYDNDYGSQDPTGGLEGVTDRATTDAERANLSEDRSVGLGTDTDSDQPGYTDQATANAVAKYRRSREGGGGREGGYDMGDYGGSIGRGGVGPSGPAGYGGYGSFGQGKGKGRGRSSSAHGRGAGDMGGMGGLGGTDRGDGGTGGGGGGGGDRVICTAMMHLGIVTPQALAIDNLYSKLHLSRVIIEGYHLWGKTVVRLMYKSDFIAKKLVAPWATAYSRHLHFKMGAVPKDDTFGRIFARCIQPTCAVIGHFRRMVLSLTRRR